jgi:hypothetical protein
MAVASHRCVLHGYSMFVMMASYRVVAVSCRACLVWHRSGSGEWLVGWLYSSIVLPLALLAWLVGWLVCGVRLTDQSIDSGFYDVKHEFITVRLCFSCSCVSYECIVYIIHVTVELSEVSEV